MRPIAVVTLLALVGLGVAACDARQAAEGGGGIQPVSATHTVHTTDAGAFAEPYDCAQCHGTQFSVTLSGPLATANGALPSFNAATLTCSNVYCHAGGPRLLLGGGTVSAPVWTPPSSVGCGACHALPGGAVGTAAWHPAVAAGVQCALCHPGYTNTTVNKPIHVNGVVNLTVPDLATNCAACHGEAGRPLPAGTPTVVRAAPPVDRKGSSSTGAVGVGAHQGHLLPGANALASPVACAECHVVPTDLAHVGPTATTPAVVTWGSLASAKGASPTLAPPPPGSSSVSCSNVYCHAGGPGLRLGGGTLTSPTWNPPSAVTCGTCHALPGGAIDTTSWHPAVAVGVDCGLCHAGYTRASVNQAVHVNGQPNVIAPDLQVNCTACHGNATRPLPPGTPEVVKVAPPVDRTGSSSTTARGVGAHQAHLMPGASTISAPIACAECHVVPASLVHVGPSPTTPATVIWGSLASANGASPTLVAPPPGSSSVSCSNVYCHAGGPGLKIGGGTLTSPTWNPPSAVTCGSCHALPGGPVDTIGWHPAIALGADCGLCHPGYTRVSVNPAVHVNGQPDVIAPGLQVNCTACHGDATRSLPPGTPEVVKAAPPVDRTGSSGTSGPGVGAHQSHLVPGAGAISLPVDCVECHVVPTNLVHVGPAPSTPATLDWGPLASAKGATPSFDSTAVTCSNYCHGQTLPVGGGTNTQPKWTTVNGSQAACGTCHGQPPSTGQHLLHTTTYTLRISCGVCHPGGYAPGVVGASAVPLHVNGALNMNPNGFTDWNPAASSGSGWRGTAIGCHGGTRYWFTGSGSSCQ